MALRRPPTTFSDSIDASDLAANSVTASELADNAVDAAAIAASAISVKPHIQYGVLQPAVAGKDLSGTALGGSYVYGTAHTDGHSYYYTDIKGSKPIKDPRIGSHFGSQRYMIGSRQLLEQETAQSGENIYSFDGREFFRGQCPTAITNENNSGGVNVNFTESSNYFEITGYFNAVNLLHKSANATRTWVIHVDGVQAHSALNVAGTIDTPLDGRFVRATSLSNIDITSSSSLSSDTTLGIHTLKMKNAGANSQYIYGIELIAQDTSNRNNIQIPSQNVVSYGKKFTVSGTPHYDPFNGFTNSTSLHSAYVDTATSLGLSTAPGSSASWAISGTNNIRPYNGGRVVKWVDSSGVIKTSVNMMPPNAQNISGTVAGTTEVTTPSATNATFTPIFSDDAIDHSLSEVAKTFHQREFGNGSANGGTGHANYADFSMHTPATADAVGYVMDDGLTSLLGEIRADSESIFPDDTNDNIYFTFIGTGLSVKNYNGSDVKVFQNIVQNLPYGSHIFRYKREVDFTTNKLYVDSIELTGQYTRLEEFSIHQPKMPPIPEDAVVIADYMLMADHVNKTSHTAGSTIAKGVRLLDSSRDVFHDCASGSMLLNNAQISDGYPFRNYMNSGSGAKNSKIPTFATSFGIDQLAAVRNDTHVAGSAVLHTDIGTHTHINAAVTLGLNIFAAQAASGQDGGFFRFEIASPIHTSSHYQTFETPYLHELVGGDRNMEQNNLIVTPDGKSWDEVTRDTSYIGNVLVTTNWASQNNTNTTVGVGDEFRGYLDAKNLFVKDFAIAYDRLICLVDGHYQIIFGNHMNGDSGGHYSKIRINGTAVRNVYYEGSGNGFIHGQLSIPLKRGDYVDHQGMHFSNETFQFQINRIK